MKAIFLGTYYQILNFLRVKKALFFSFVFPVFLYFVFIFIWGNDSSVYTKFICTGIIAIITASNAIMALGRIIVQYKHDGMDKVLKTIPYAYFIQMSALVLSRIVMITCAAGLLLIFSSIISKTVFSLEELLTIEGGVIMGVYVFSLIGQIIAELLEDSNSEGNIFNVIFYVIIFLSDCFYPITEMNSTIATFVHFNPITPVLHIIRGEGDWYLIIVAIVFLQFLVYFISKNKNLKR